jgi:hypothetical protein
MAWSDREWILEGAAVHVSLIGFDDGTETSRTVDGQCTTTINTNLTSDADTTAAARLRENDIVPWSIGTQKGGQFEFEMKTARQLLGACPESS